LELILLFTTHSAVYVTYFMTTRNLSRIQLFYWSGGFVRTC